MFSLSVVVHPLCSITYHRLFVTWSVEFVTRDMSHMRDSGNSKYFLNCV